MATPRLDRDETLKVRDVMRKDAPSTTPDETAAAAWTRMNARGLEHLIVLEEGKVVGTLAAHDLAGPTGGSHGHDYAFSAFLLARPRSRRGPDTHPSACVAGAWQRPVRAWLVPERWLAALRALGRAERLIEPLAASRRVKAKGAKECDRRPQTLHAAIRRRFSGGAENDSNASCRSGPDSWAGSRGMRADRRRRVGRLRWRRRRDGRRHGRRRCTGLPRRPRPSRHDVPSGRRVVHVA